jgi:hypothetical protein
MPGKNKKRVVINPATPQADFQVKIVLDKSNFEYFHAKPKGEDIRFYQTDGVKLCYWIESWDTSGSSIIWVKVSAIGTTAIDMYYGDDHAVPESDGKSVFLFFDDASSKHPFTDGFKENINGMEGEPAILSDSEKIMMWTTKGLHEGISCSYSADGINFTMHQTSIPSGCCRCAITKFTDTFYLYAACKDMTGRLDSVIKLFTSTDGLHFLDCGVVMSRSEPYDDLHLANMFVWHENNRWYMLYEANGTGTNNSWVINLAVSKDGISWEKHSGNPVMTSKGNGLGNPELIRNGNGEVYKIDGKCYMYYHQDGSIFRAYSSDLVNWIREGVVEGQRFSDHPQWSAGDHALVEFKGKSYLYWTVSNQVDDAHINMAMDNRSICELAALPPHTTWDTYYGNTPYKDWRAQLGGVEYADGMIITTSPGYPNSLNEFSFFVPGSSIVYSAKVKANRQDRLYLLLKAEKSSLQAEKAMGIRLNFAENSVDLLDNGFLKATTYFHFYDHAWYTVEWIIKGDYSMEIRVWNTEDQKPELATLTQKAFAPEACGNYARLSSMPVEYSQVNCWNSFIIRKYDGCEPIASVCP